MEHHHIEEREEKKQTGYFVLDQYGNPALAEGTDHILSPGKRLYMESPFILFALFAICVFFYVFYTDQGHNYVKNKIENDL